MAKTSLISCHFLEAIDIKSPWFRQIHDEFPKYLESVPFDKKIRLELRDSGIPKILLLADPAPSHGKHSIVIEAIYSLAADEEKAFALISSLKEKIRPENYDWLELAYTKDACSPLYESAIVKAGWHPPHLVFYECTFETESFNPPWLTKKLPLRKGFTASSWNKIQSEDLKEIQHILDSRGVFPSLSPLRGNSLPDLPGSLFFKKDKKVIGWIVTKKSKPDTIVFESFYLLSEYRILGIAIPFLAEAIHKHKKSGTKWTVFKINITQTSMSWLRFFKNNLLPYSNSVKKIYFCNINNSN